MAKPVERITSRERKGAIREHVDPESRITTDDLSSYHGIGRDFAGGHSVVRHSHGEYVNADGEFTNTAESFFALLKRAHYGTHHHYSKKHLGRYVDEQGFKWDHRKVTDGERMVEAIKGAEGKRLMYQEPI